MAMIWTPFELARLNEAWFAQKPLNVCDQLSGNHCQQDGNNASGATRYRAIMRIVWGWCGGSEADGILWDTNSPESRADRRGLAWTPNELLAIIDITEKRDSLPGKRLDDAYIAALLNRDEKEIQDGRSRTQRPLNDTLGVL